MPNKHFEERIYDLVTVGERGQIVIPQKARKDFNLKPGDRLLAIKGIGDFSIVLLKPSHISRIADQIKTSFNKIEKTFKSKGKKKNG